MTADGRLSLHERHQPHAAVTDGAVDPVCGMAVDPVKAEHRCEHAGHTYYFCSHHCRARFEAEPARYLAPATRVPAEPTAGGARWTCPMHPQIVQSQPGSCPICGMAREPMSPVEGEAINPELVAMTRRFWIAAALPLPLVLLAMADNRAVLRPETGVWLQVALATSAVLWGGWPFFQRGWSRSRTAGSTCSP
jgi:Cu+-exporting ATPase